MKQIIYRIRFKVRATDWEQMPHGVWEIVSEGGRSDRHLLEECYF